MGETNRTATAVAFLVADMVAQRLALSWPLVDGRSEERAVLRAWAQAAGVPRSDTRRVGRALRLHGICRDDGTVCPEAERVLQHEAAEALRGSPRRRRS